ncbi:MAG: YceI family protein [Parvularcula sp.]
MGLRAFLLTAGIALGSTVLGACGALAVAAEPALAETESFAAAPPQTGGFALVPAQSTLAFSIRRLGVSRIKGHFNSFDVALNYNDEAPEASLVDATITVSSVEMENDAYTQMLLGPDWFDAAQYPEASFRSIRILRRGENEGVLAGELTIRGISRPVELDILFEEERIDPARQVGLLSISARGSFRRDDFGMEGYRRFVGKNVGIQIDAQFERPFARLAQQ